MPRHAALLDTNVLYPYALRQILLDVAEKGGFEPRWSGHILDELGRHLKADAGLTDEKWKGLVSAMQDAFPSATVKDYEPLIPACRDLVSDPDDAHVVAAAKQAGCERIVTENTSDFHIPPGGEKELRTQTSDEFLTAVFMDPESRRHVYAGLLGMSEAMREDRGVAAVLDDLWNRSRLYGLCQQISIDLSQNLGVSVDGIDEGAVRKRIVQIEQGMGI